MGIKDLLQQLNCRIELSSVISLRGQRVAIDCSGWLHKGVYGSAEDYMDAGFIDQQLYVDFIIGRLRNLITAGGVTPVVVFDGRRNNMKSETREARSDARAIYLEQGKRLLENIRNSTDEATSFKLRAEAISCFQRGLSVTAEMERNAIAAVRKMGVQVIVAPYEADSQLAYLCTSGYCAAVLTEDSDLLVYSAISGLAFPIMYKFDKCGSVQSIDLTFMMGEAAGSDAANVDTQSSNTSTKFVMELQKHFQGTRGRRMFVQMAILAGCDYSESIHGIGLLKAQEAIIKCKDAHDDKRFYKVCRNFKLQGKNVPDGFLSRVARAELLFHYHPVYDMATKSIRPFRDYNTSVILKSEDDSEEVEESSPKAGKSKGKGKGKGKAAMSPKKMCDDNLTPSGPWVGPPITPEQIIDLGASTADFMHYGGTQCPSHITISDLCEGRYSVKDFTSIVPRYPWDIAALRPPSNGKLKSSNWHLRRNLMSLSAGPLPSQPRSSSGSVSLSSNSSSSTGVMKTRSSPVKAVGIGSIQHSVALTSTIRTHPRVLGPPLPPIPPPTAHLFRPPKPTSQGTRHITPISKPMPLPPPSPATRRVAMAGTTHIYIESSSSSIKTEFRGESSSHGSSNSVKMSAPNPFNRGMLPEPVISSLQGLAQLDPFASSDLDDEVQMVLHVPVNANANINTLSAHSSKSIVTPDHEVGAGLKRKFDPVTITAGKAPKASQKKAKVSVGPGKMKVANIMSFFQSK